jgi:hypothetical protein
MGGVFRESCNSYKKTSWGDHGTIPGTHLKKSKMNNRGKIFNGFLFHCVSELEKLDELLSAGFIQEDEYKRRKAEILGVDESEITSPSETMDPDVFDERPFIPITENPIDVFEVPTQSEDRISLKSEAPTTAFFEGEKGPQLRFLKVKCGDAHPSSVSEDYIADSFRKVGSFQVKHYNQTILYRHQRPSFIALEAVSSNC